MIVRIITAVFFLLAASPAAIITPASRVPDSDVTWPNSMWEDAGRTGGIPAQTQTVFANVTDAPYNATGDGVTDDRTAINDCIAACPVGEVVFFPAGTYYIGSVINVTKGIILRGAGIGVTTILGGALEGIIRVGPTAGSITGTYSNPYYDGVATNITAGATRGSTTITVAATTGMVVGNVVMVAGENPDVVNTHNDEGDGYSWSPAAGYLTKITAINVLDVDLADPLPWTYTVDTAYPSATGSPTCNVYNKSDAVVNFVEGAGVEDMSFDGNGGTCAVGFVHCYDCWMHNCEVREALGLNVTVICSAKCTFRNNYIHETFGSGSGSGYGIISQVKSTKNLFESNIFNRLATNFDIQNGSVGNVVAYNYVGPQDKYFQPTWQIQALIHHRAHPQWNLFEGNYTTNIVGDNIHGSNSHSTLFRNRIHGQNPGKTNFLGTIWFNRNSSYLNSVGNILGTAGTHDVYQQDVGVGWPTDNIAFSTNAIYTLGFVNWHHISNGPDPPRDEQHDQNVVDTVYQHGDWDVVTDGITWDAGNADHTLPDSLYLAAKPSWWGGMPWPPYDPANPTADSPTLIPAGLRFLGKRGRKPSAARRAVLTGN